MRRFGEEDLVRSDEPYAYRSRAAQVALEREGKSKNLRGRSECQNLANDTLTRGLQQQQQLPLPQLGLSRSWVRAGKEQVLGQSAL